MRVSLCGDFIYTQNVWGGDVSLRNHPFDLQEQFTFSSAKLGTDIAPHSLNCQAVPCLQMRYVPTTTTVILLDFTLVSSTWSQVANISWLLDFSLLPVASSYIFFLHLDFSVESFVSPNWFAGLFIYSGYKTLFGYVLQISSLGLWLLFFTLFIVAFDAHKCLHFNGVKFIHLFPGLFLVFCELFKKSFHALRV